MDTLLDTNVLIAAGQSSPVHSAEVWGALEMLRKRDVRICVVSQNLCEFWSVCTRPRVVNGLGLNSVDTLARLTEIEMLFHRPPDSDEVYGRWRNLVLAHDVRGKQVHDARIVAAMEVHGVTDILTYNTADFRRYPSIRVLDPAEAA